MTSGSLLARIDLRTQDLTSRQLRAQLPCTQVTIDTVLPQVESIVKDIAKRGVPAALEYGQSFDQVCPSSIRVDPKHLHHAVEQLNPDLKAALIEAIQRIRTVHTDQIPSDITTVLAPGATVTQQWVPMQRVGLYVPGGSAVYPSSVVMNVIPAQAAGVESLVIASPPQAHYDGLPHPTILATAALLGVKEVWAVGGAQGIALLAYGGTDTNGDVLEPVDMITGPGNIYVAAAKRLCRSVVGIDAEAGPTEVVILADQSANPHYIAADLISQAEHDELASSVLITDSVSLADEVEAAIKEQLTETSHQDRIRAALTGPQSAVILVEDIQVGIRVADSYAAEHLEIHTRDAESVAKCIRHAGAIFVGPFSPVSLGDYCAGSNHVLPTAGSARYSAGLSTQTFLRQIPIVKYSQDALSQVAGHITTLAEAEDLPAHGQAVRRRFIS